MNTHLTPATLMAIASVIGFLGLLTVLTIVARDMMRFMVAALGSQVVSTFGVWFRAGCYFALAFLSVVADKVGEILMHNTWPSPQVCIMALLSGTIAGLVALKAFNDSSGQKILDELKSKKNGNGNGNGGGSSTEFGTALTTMASLGKTTGQQPPVQAPQTKQPETSKTVSAAEVVQKVLGRVKEA